MTSVSATALSALVRSAASLQSHHFNTTKRAQKPTAFSAISHDLPVIWERRPCTVLCAREWRYSLSGAAARYSTLYLNCSFWKERKNLEASFFGIVSCSFFRKMYGKKRNVGKNRNNDIVKNSPGKTRSCLFFFQADPAWIQLPRKSLPSWLPGPAATVEEIRRW